MCCNKKLKTTTVLLTNQLLKTSSTNAHMNMNKNYQTCKLTLKISKSNLLFIF